MLRILLALVIGAAFAQSAAQEGVKKPDYVTSQACAACHATQFSEWSESHHRWAWREPTSESVLGDFGNAAFEHKGFRYRFLIEDGTRFVLADGPDGKLTRYRVRYVVGVTPLQHYLVETGGGRLQALDVTWDTERNRWYHLYPDQNTSAGNGLHWTGSYKNWNARCAECHATNYRKNYDPLKDIYSSQQSEIGVGCEACHGPGEAHVAWAMQPQSFDPNLWAGVNALGLLATYAAGDSASEINLCAACHSRREPLGADSPPPGAPFADHYRLALLREGLCFPDGQILDEVYVYGSFLQSKMYARGVRCTDCHDAHSYAVKLEGNALCTRCHNAGGNAAFPTLKKGEYDTASHHFHRQGALGSACADCHMPERHYMVVDGRRDHSFRLPRPDLSTKLATPNPCTLCHQSESPVWAAQEIKARLPQSRSGEFHYGEVFAQAGSDMSEHVAHDLLALATDEAMPAIVRGSALHRLAAVTNDELAEQTRAPLSDPSALVRSAAIRTQRSINTEQAIARIAPLLMDSVRSVRLEAAKAMLAMPAPMVPEAYHPPLRKAMREFQQSLHAKADFPEIQLVIGGVALTLRNLSAAESAFRRAVQMDPQLVEAWLMLARIETARGDRVAASATLGSAIQANPDDDSLRRALRDLGAVQGGEG